MFQPADCEMNWNFVLGKRRGRIARKPFWIATIAIYGLSASVVWLAYYTAVHYRTLNGAEFGTIVNCLVSVQLFLMCPVIIKRLHDRDRSGWWLIPVWIVPQAYLFIGKAYVQVLNATYGGVETACNLALIVIIAWAIIELAFRRGTAGPNRFGVNPLPIRLPSSQPVAPAILSRRSGLSFGEHYMARLQRPENRLSAFKPVSPEPIVGVLA
jgi:uncharacterized membrane protein YhaH (DUF805 family)